MNNLKIGLLSFSTILLLTVASSASGQWEQINGRGGSVVTSLAANGTNIYAGTNAGITVSTDNGLTWSSLDSGLTDSNITALFADGPNVVAGTNSGSLFRLSSSGKGWLLSGFIGEVTAFSMLDPYLYAASDRAIGLSTDMGQTWKIIGPAFAGLDDYCLAGMSTVLFAGTNNGILYSLDFGVSWVRPSSNFLQDIPILCLTVQGNNLFAGTENDGTPTNGCGIYRSTDDGDSWALVYDDPSVTVSAICVSGSDIFAGTDQGVLLSMDSGINWTTMDTGLTNTTVQAITHNGSTLFAGTKGDGVFRSIDSGLSWSSKNSGLSGLYIRALLQNGGNLYVGAGDPEYGIAAGGVLLSTDEGFSWKEVSPRSASQDVVSLAKFDNHLFIGAGGDSNVFRSTDNGASWKVANVGSASDAIFCFTTIGTNLFAGSFEGGMFLSTDTGANWIAIDSGLTGHTVICVATIGNIIFAGTYSGIFRSTDSGKLWAQVNTGLIDTIVLSLSVSGENLFVGTGGGGVFLSGDSATSWRSINNGLPLDVDYYSFAVSGKNLFVAGDENVFFTSDFGANWVEVSTGLPNESYTYVNNLAIDSVYLFAQTYHQSNSILWRRPLSEMIQQQSAVAQSPSTEYDIHLYPNPLTQSTKISFTLPESGASIVGDAAEVTIVNLLGSEVARLFSGRLSAGEHSFEWDAGQAAAGTYFCALRTINGVQRVAMVVER